MNGEAMRLYYDLGYRSGRFTQKYGKKPGRGRPGKYELAGLAEGEILTLDEKTGIAYTMAVGGGDQFHAMSAMEVAYHVHAPVPSSVRRMLRVEE